MTDILTLAQTGKLARPIAVLLYGRSHWNGVIGFHALARHGMIDADDLALFDFVDVPPTALKLLQRNITPAAEPAKPPDFAHSRDHQNWALGAFPDRDVTKTGFFQIEDGT